MNLNFKQIKDITTGAVRIEEAEDGAHFYRFTQQQETMYKNRNADFYLKSFATSGVRFRFRTNSQSLFLKVHITPGSSRRYFSFDIFVNGRRTDTLNNFDGFSFPRDYTRVTLPLGEFSKEFLLGEGEKEVSVCFPWSVKAVVETVSIDDGSFIEPIRPGKKILCFGDSISQGYDALYTSEKYTSRLAEMLDAEEHNKAIGAEIFFPGLTELKDNFEPDYITVAYGTNDWYHCTEEEFTHNCKGFFLNLCKNYPNSAIFAITPIWRRDMNDKKSFGDFKKVGEIIQKQAAVNKNVYVINGFDFVPADEELFADMCLHPNDKGFAHYFENLACHIKGIL